MPLSMAPMGIKSFICKINGKDETRRFLGSLGFVEGEPVTVICELGGNMIVNVMGARVAISKAMANRVMIG